MFADSGCRRILWHRITRRTWHRNGKVLAALRFGRKALADEAGTSARPLGIGPNQDREDLLRESVPIRARHPQHLDILPPLQRIGERVTVRVHRGDDGGFRVKERPNRVPKPVGGKLHLAQLVDHQHAACRDVLERRKRDALEHLEVHAIPADPRPAPMADLSQGALFSGHGLNPKPRPASALAYLAGQEARNGDVGVAEQRDQPVGDGALADAGASLEEQARRAQREYVPMCSPAASAWPSIAASGSFFEAASLSIQSPCRNDWLATVNSATISPIPYSATGTGIMAKRIELRRHTDNDGDVLTDEGTRAALAIGSSLRGGYALLVSTGAQRATQTLACFACALRDPIPGGAVVEPGLRSEREDRWRDAYGKAGSARLEDLRSADPELVESDSRILGEALIRVLERLGDDETALVVGHSPTNEAAVLGLTGEIVGPMSKGSGVLVTADGDGFSVERLD